VAAPGKISRNLFSFRETGFAKGKWTGRQFQVLDADGTTVAQLATTSGVFSMRQDSLAFEMTSPVLSIVQAIGLAQCMRAAVEASRAAAAS